MQPVDGDVAARRRAAWRSAGSASSARRAPGRPTCRSARRGSACAPRRRRGPGRAGGGERRDADVPVAGVGDHDDVGARARRGARAGAPGRVSEPTSSSPSTKTMTPTGSSSPKHPQRAEVGDDAGLVVGGAAAVEPVVALGRLERRGVPVGVVALGLDVVVGVEQHGRRALRPGLVRDHRRGAAVGRQRSRRSKPSAANRSRTASALRRTSPARAGSALTDSIRTRSSRSRRTPGRTSCRRARRSRRSSCPPP